MHAVFILYFLMTDENRRFTVEEGLVKEGSKERTISIQQHPAFSSVQRACMRPSSLAWSNTVNA